MEAEDEDEREDGLETADARPAALPAPVGEGAEWTGPDRLDGPRPWDSLPAGEAEAPEDGAPEGSGAALEEDLAKIAGPQRMTASPWEGLRQEGRTAPAGAGWAAAERDAGDGLEALYRQTAQAVSPAALALPVGQAGRAFRAEEPGRAAALTVDELDRAVRRDSRRYDGAMNIF